MKSINPGISAEVQIEVSKDMLASQWGSGIVEVFSTPAMVGLMEGAAEKAVRPFLDDGETTVGTWISVKHLAPTPPGMKVKAVAVLRAVEGRRLTFKVEAWDEVERIGEGEHERFVVDQERFMNRAQEKAKKSC
jgi:predicted thioesterase